MRIEVYRIDLNTIYDKIIHLNLKSKTSYIDWKIRLKKLLFYFKLNAQFYVLVKQSFTKKCWFIFHKPKFSFIFEFLDIYFFVLENYFKTNFILVKNLKNFTLFGLRIHFIPKSQGASFFKRPFYRIIQAYSFLIPI